MSPPPCDILKTWRREDLPNPLKQTTMKNIFTAAVIATVSLCALDSVVPQAAQAKDYDFGLVGGYETTIDQSGSIYEPDYLLVEGPRGQEIIKVTCAPFDWDAEGPNTSAFVRHITREWCASAFE